MIHFRVHRLFDRLQLHLPDALDDDDDSGNGDGDVLQTLGWRQSKRMDY